MQTNQCNSISENINFDRKSITMPGSLIQQSSQPYFNIDQMVKTVERPYESESFLLTTFNSNLNQIQLFSMLKHEEKLQFYLLMQQYNLTKQMDKRKYQEILTKMANFGSAMNQIKKPIEVIPENKIEKEIDMIYDKLLPDIAIQQYANYGKFTEVKTLQDEQFQPAQYQQVEKNKPIQLKTDEGQFQEQWQEAECMEQKQQQPKIEQREQQLYISQQKVDIWSTPIVQDVSIHELMSGTSLGNNASLNEQGEDNIQQEAGEVLGESRQEKQLAFEVAPQIVIDLLSGEVKQSIVEVHQQEPKKQEKEQQQQFFEPAQVAEQPLHSIQNQTGKQEEIILPQYPLEQAIVSVNSAQFNMTIKDLQVFSTAATTPALQEEEIYIQSTAKVIQAKSESNSFKYISGPEQKVQIFSPLKDMFVIPSKQFLQLFSTNNWEYSQQAHKSLLEYLHSLILNQNSYFKVIKDQLLIIEKLRYLSEQSVLDSIEEEEEMVKKIQQTKQFHRKVEKNSQSIKEILNLFVTRNEQGQIYRCTQWCYIQNKKSQILASFHSHRPFQKLKLSWNENQQLKAYLTQIITIKLISLKNTDYSITQTQVQSVLVYVLGQQAKRKKMQVHPIWNQSEFMIKQVEKDEIYQNYKKSITFLRKIYNNNKAIKKIISDQKKQETIEKLNIFSQQQLWQLICLVNCNNPIEFLQKLSEKLQTICSLCFQKLDSYSSFKGYHLPCYNLMTHLNQI